MFLRARGVQGCHSVVYGTYVICHNMTSRNFRFRMCKLYLGHLVQKLGMCWLLSMYKREAKSGKEITREIEIQT